MDKFRIYKIDKDNFGSKINLLEEQYEFMFPIFGPQYPCFKKWYFSKVIPEVKNGQRISYVIQKGGLNNIYGVSILKISDNPYKHNKICSFYLSPEIRSQGIGSELISSVIKDVGDLSITLKTSITIAEDTLLKVENKKFQSFLAKFGLHMHGAIKSCYRTGYSENIYAGNIVYPSLLGNYVN
ncbi:acyl-coa n-acyltransferase [Lucifera butyrica]|uniref:Acyl-coa n-acyltransferase n=1 Tax=Lucifera butyrica TaxID=1351585 RepID=A0A498R6I1_9FIRM|nr:GNAT family N-acetyltransferase [Lucifera butyrica]VBB07104.1 acyl-coa n-acyltransferase [Lucifera butyrica]